jgi:hypothetical protein
MQTDPWRSTTDQQTSMTSKLQTDSWSHHGIPKLGILRHPQHSFYDILSMQTAPWHRKAGKQTFYDIQGMAS